NEADADVVRGQGFRDVRVLTDNTEFIIRGAQDVLKVHRAALGAVLIGSHMEQSTIASCPVRSFGRLRPMRGSQKNC
ncbi:hypothetical protein, partial [uncultured Paracoccus sp.]|uniref:hypothetical protein n=1 Tax=uncultured Paracoccus sp. TaxID=189685 RepID=UPI002632828B